AIDRLLPFVLAAPSPRAQFAFDMAARKPGKLSVLQSLLARPEAVVANPVTAILACSDDNAAKTGALLNVLMTSTSPAAQAAAADGLLKLKTTLPEVKEALISRLAASPIQKVRASCRAALSGLFP